jgi:hypothetical protein
MVKKREREGERGGERGEREREREREISALAFGLYMLKMSLTFC